MKRLRHDLNHLTSAALLVAAAAAVLTGIVAHLWDLHGFWYHTWAGYVMTALALVHVWLNWQRLVSYARFRLRRGPAAFAGRGRAGRRRVPGRERARPAPATTAATDPNADTADGHAADAPTVGELARSLAVSRRGLLGVAVGGIGGWLAGRGLRPPPVIPGGSDVGLVYHEWSKPGVVDALGSLSDWGEQPPLYKTYPDAPRVVLPEPDFGGGLPTEEAIATRRSTRTFAGRPLAPADLSRLLWLTAGISGERFQRARRTAPSSGALYPIELYPVVHDVEGVAPGVYHYGVADHVLELVRGGDVRGRVARQGLMQEFLGEANVVLLLTVIFQRMRFKYQDRTYRYGLLEAGHLGQNAYLAATSMGLGACAVGAFLDDRINGMLGVDGREEAAIYMLSIGTV